jgi:hypothetical protein
MLPIGSVGIAIGDTVTGRARAVKRHGVEPLRPEGEKSSLTGGRNL